MPSKATLFSDSCTERPLSATHFCHSGIGQPSDAGNGADPTCLPNCDGDPCDAAFIGGDLGWVPADPGLDDSRRACPSPFRAVCMACGVVRAWGGEADCAAPCVFDAGVAERERPAVRRKEFVRDSCDPDGSWPFMPNIPFHENDMIKR